MSTDKLTLPSNAQWGSFRKNLLKVLGNLTIRHFRKSFELQRFNDYDSEPWQEVKRRETGENGTFKYRVKGGTQYKKKEGFKKGSKAARTNPILIGKGSGNLAKSFAMKPPTDTSVTVETMGVAEDYAAVHNEGLHAGRGNGFTMPKREFAGDGDLLDREITNEIEKYVQTFFDKF